MMYTFGYSNRLNGPLRAVIAMAVGVIMIVFSEDALNIVVKIIAALLLASGIVSLSVGLKKRNDSTSKLMNFNAVVDIVIAVLLFIFNDWVSTLIISLVGVVLLLFGLFQIFAMISANRVMRLGFSPFIMPVVVTLVGGFIAFNPLAKEVMTMVAGGALLFYGITEFISSRRMKKAMDEYEVRQAEVRPAEPEETVVVKDVEYEKVDDQA